MDASYQSLFSYKTLSEATSAFSSGDVLVPSDVLVKALAATSEALDSTVTACMTMERYILLTIPKMEDGNNFGVTVQLAALKQMKDDREKLEKLLEELSKYASSRADAMEKCKLSSVSSSKTTTSSTSNADTKGGEKAGSTSSTSTSTEEKTVESANQVAEAAFRQQAVWAVDVLYYSKARTAFMSALTCYVTAVDFLDKNQEKIAAPKGTTGGRASYSSMY
jgi:Proteasome activator pa28 beta subunit